MHEYSIVAALVERVQHELAQRPGAVARVVHVKIGELAGVELPLLATAFDTFGCTGATLAIEQVPAAWRCTRCQRAIPLGERLQCCGKPARLAAGDEIVLERIAMEVRDV